MAPPRAPPAAPLCVAGSAVWIRRGGGAAPAPLAPRSGGGAAAEWAPATVVSVDGPTNTVLARTEDGEDVRVSPSDVELRGNDDGVQDLVRLGHMNEPSVLAALSRRYASGQIYTRTGPGIVIAVNPFAPMPDLYSAATMDAYRLEGSDAEAAAAAAPAPRPPHIFSVASKAYWQMRQDGAGQALLVTGESGAGKTETSKLLMKYLAYLGGYKAAADGGGDDSTRPSVEQRVLESNPLLEAFGNAKTVRNDNSSRFGKYIELHFCPGGSISGARIHTYLLERSRLVAPSKGERNYHIFYQMLAGATPDERARWRLPGGAAGHALTAMAGCLSLPGVDDGRHFLTTRHAMRSVGMAAEDQEQIFRLLAALLHLGDVTFDPCPKGTDGCTLKPASSAALGTAAELLGCDAAALAKAVTTRTRVTPDGPIVSPLGAKAAAETRDALSKVVYARLFDWLVARINSAIGEDPNRTSTIGLLDIYGFESFEFNDLEQFCINLANEKLQQHFNHHVFKQEQAEYEREGINWSYIEFIDNQDVLDLIEGRMGLMDLIDEACRFPTATNKDLAEKLLSGAVPAASPRFSRGKRSATAFTIQHYAGPVTYQTDHMLDKNRDFVIAEHQALMSSSVVPLARALFAPDDAGDGAANGGGGGGMKGSKSNGNLKGFQFVSVGSQFKRQLAELASKLSQLQPHYVRCIKPNPRNATMELDAPYTLEQLKCGGVMEAVRISNAGYPLRRTFGEFVETYWPIAPELLRARAERRHKALAAAAAEGPDAAAAAAAAAGEGDREAVLGVLRGLGERAAAAPGGEGGAAPALREGADWQIGHSMVFMRASAAAALARLHGQAHGAAATRVQAAWRGALARREARRRRAAAVKLQAGARGMLARREAHRAREARAAAALQAAWRGRAARRRAAGLRAAALSLQVAWRGRAARIKLADRRAEEAMARYAAQWASLATRGAAAMLRATASLRAAARAEAARAADAKAALLKAPRARAASRITAAWRLAKTPTTKYREEHHAAAAVIQAHWRARALLRRDARAARLRAALVEFAARWHAAVTVQAHWRRFVAAREARAAREALRRAAFKKNAAMFESMASAAKAPLPQVFPPSAFKITASTANGEPDGAAGGAAGASASGAGGRPPLRPGAAAAAASDDSAEAAGGHAAGGGRRSWLSAAGGALAGPSRIKLGRLNRASDRESDGGSAGGRPSADGLSSPPSPRSLARVSDMSAVSLTAHRVGDPNEVVKSDNIASLEQGARLQHRVGTLRDKHKVTRLLGVWQQRLHFQQQKQQLSRQRRQEVWERQQQLMRQHQLRVASEHDESLVPALAPIGEGPPPAGPPVLF